MRVIVAGWFSFEQGHATAGDLLSRDLICQWLEDAGFKYDLATAIPFNKDGLALTQCDPNNYSHAIFVCGPFEKKKMEAEFLGRFAESFVMGVNLTMIPSVTEWNPFDFLIERGTSPDLVFMSKQKKVPIVGVCLVEDYEGAMTHEANSAIERIIKSREVVKVPIDTRLDENTTGLNSSAEIESLIARMDVLVTTRLHGMVLALKNGIPVVAIDPEAGGSKIKRQAEIVNWSKVFTVDAMSDLALQEALNYCFTEEARNEAERCSMQALNEIELIHQQFIDVLNFSDNFGNKARQRMLFAKKFFPNSEVVSHPHFIVVIKNYFRQLRRFWQ